MVLTYTKKAVGRFGVLLGMFCLAAVVPATAYAGALVVPQPPTPITPHAAPSPSTAPTPVPTLPEQGPAPAPGSTPGQGGNASYPYPEGLPKSTDPDCDVSCQEEWYAYYSARADEVMRETSDANVPSYGVYLTYRSLEAKAKEIKATIEEQGGDPEALTGKGDDAIDGEDSADGSSSSGDAPAVPDTSTHQTATPAPATVAADLLVDAISGATPILKPDPMQGWAIGEYEFDPPPLLGAIIDWITGGSQGDAPQSSDQPGTSGGQVPGRPAASGAGTDSNGNYCTKATKSDGKVVTCVD